MKDMEISRIEMVPSVRQPGHRRQQAWVLLLVVGLVLGGAGCGSGIANTFLGKRTEVTVRLRGQQPAAAECPLF
jgi:hypothetical protein